MNIPSSVTEILWNSFAGCDNLETVNITDLSAWLKIYFGNAYSNPLNNGAGLYLNGTLVTELVVPDEIKVIKQYAFHGCGSLRSVYVHSGVTEIGNSAFRDCTGLTSVKLLDGLTEIATGVFCGCSGLTSVDIPDGVTSIGSSAFSGCSGLTSINIPSGVTNINLSIFGGCVNLDAINITDLSAWCKIDFEEVESSSPYDHQPSLFSYTDKLYLNGELITELMIPDDVTEIKPYVFYGYRGLVSVKIPECVTEIGSYAFAECESLSSVDISSRTIDKYAFSDCGTLSSMKIAPSVKAIREYAFDGCDNLEEVHIDDLSAWCSISFASNPLYYANKLYLNGELITDLVIPDDIKYMRDYTFNGFKGLRSVEIPDGVTNIGKYTFAESSLTSITIPSSITKIGDYAFKDCDDLEKVNIANLSAWLKINLGYKKENNPLTGAKLYLNGELVTDLVIPDNISSINDCAFYGCSSIKSVTIPETVSEIGSSAFICPNLKSVVLSDGIEGNYIFGGGDNLSEVIFLGNDFHSAYDSFLDVCLSQDAIIYVFNDENFFPSSIIHKPFGLSIPAYVYNGSGPSTGIEITGNTSSYGIECVGVDSGERIETGLNCANTADVRIYKKGAADGQAVEYHVNLPQKYYYLVNKAPLTVKAEPLAVEYGDPVTSDDFTLTYSGFIDGEDESVLTELPVANCEAGTLPDAGEHHIIVSGGDAKNYEFVYDNSGILTVVSAPLTGRIGNVEIEYGTEEITFTDIIDYIEYSGFVNNDTEVEFIEAPEVLTTWTSDAEPGEYPIVLNGGKAKNYDVTFVPGTLTVVPASQSIVWTQSFDYDVYEDMEIELNATATSGLPVSYSSDNPHIAEIFIENGKTMMRCTGVGTVTITATQDGDTYYEPAESVSKTITILAFGGAGTVDAGAVGCYPNPAVERLNVTGTADDSVIRIFDLNGRLLGTLKGEDGTTTAVDVSGLAQGDYLLVVATGGKTATLRFTKK